VLIDIHLLRFCQAGYQIVTEDATSAVDCAGLISYNHDCLVEVKEL
jgi:hypothetical protein